MARVDGTALVAGAHEALLDDPEFLREIVQVALNRTRLRVQAISAPEEAGGADDEREPAL